MYRAGLSKAQFLRAESHRDYIQAAIDARESADKTYLYRAYDVGEGLPSPGHISCAAREEAANTINSIADFKANPHGAYHCDIVLGYDTDLAKKPPGEEAARLCLRDRPHVLNAVMMTEMPIGSGMRLKPLKAPYARNWFAILRYVGRGNAARFRKVPAKRSRRCEKASRFAQHLSLSLRPYRISGQHFLVLLSPGLDGFQRLF